MTGKDLLRDDLVLLAENVPEGSRVLDLGCGDGSLLKKLRDERNCIVHGIEIDQKAVASAIAKGISVSCIDLDSGLDMFADNTFDMVVLSQTLQMVRHPANLLRQMLRISDKSFVSYPNFGHWKVRSYLMFRGRMPISEQIPYTWYETPNIHHTTVKDFRDLIHHIGGKIIREIMLQERGDDAKIVTFLPELRGDTVLTLFEKR